jgi:hypothetical protein
MQAAIVLESDLGDVAAVARRLADERVQEDLDARVGADFVQRTLHCFRIENHEHPRCRTGGATAPRRRSLPSTSLAIPATT